MITKKQFESFVEGYKTNSAKKNFCTRCIKSHKSYIEDIEDAYKKKPKDKIYGFYLGERIFAGTITTAKMELVMMQEVRNKI